MGFEDLKNKECLINERIQNRERIQNLENQRNQLQLKFKTYQHNELN